MESWSHFLRCPPSPLPMFSKCLIVLVYQVFVGSKFVKAVFTGIELVDFTVFKNRTYIRVSVFNGPILGFSYNSYSKIRLSSSMFGYNFLEHETKLSKILRRKLSNIPGTLKSLRISTNSSWRKSYIDFKSNSRFILEVYDLYKWAH